MPPSFLDPAERNDLWTRGVHGPDPALARRARALLALDQGFPTTRVARMCGCSRITVWNWRRRYLEDRVAANLADRRTDREGRALAALRLPARAAALWDLARRAGPVAPGAGRLGLRPADADRLARAARAHADPQTRYHAALLVAYDRGAPTCAVAAAGACDRSTVSKAPARHLGPLLESLRPPRARAAPAAGTPVAPVPPDRPATAEPPSQGATREKKDGRRRPDREPTPGTRGSCKPKD